MDDNTLAFFEFLRGGLWEKEVQLSSYELIDFKLINQLAEEQSVVGVVTAGLEHVVDVKVPQEILLQFIGCTLQIEQQNKLMNEFVERLNGRLRGKEIYTLLIKGQGIAQCYEKPLWRSSGDVDLLLSDSNYNVAAKFLSEEATSVEEENAYNKHLAMTIEGWLVELHGTLRCGLWKSLDKELDKVQEEVFYGGKVRSWMNGHSHIFLPAPDEDVFFVFTHILEHFYKEGIGLRQICDWTRLLWTYRDSIDTRLLEKRIKRARITSEWMAFAALAVNYMGMPVEAMPFYDSSRKWSRKAGKIMSFVLETGNFGHNRDYSYYKKYSYFRYKTISICRHLKDTFKYFLIFPLDSVKVIMLKMYVGFTVVLKGK